MQGRIKTSITQHAIYILDFQMPRYAAGKLCDFIASLLKVFSLNGGNLRFFFQDNESEKQ